MLERRKRTRYAIDYNIVVVDLGSAKPIGKVVNITVDGGILLKSREPIQLHRTYQISFSLPAFLKVATVRYQISSLWSSEAPTRGYYWTGCEAAKISPETVKNIELLTEELGRATVESTEAVIAAG